MMFNNKKIMVVVAHPDDELLGLGASMNKLINDDNVNTHLVILGEGITSRSESRDIIKWENELKIHKQNINSAMNHIGYHSLSVYDFPDNRFDTVALLDIIKVVENEKVNYNPDIIFTHHGGDLNIDHQRTFQAVMTACRPLENETVKTIITFETPSGTEWQASVDPRNFSPNLFITISQFNLSAKINGMQAYQYESRNYPHPRSPEALEVLAKRCGVIVGTQFAEAFQIIRHIY